MSICLSVRPSVCLRTPTSPSPTHHKTIQQTNQQRLKRLVMNGPGAHPGANIIRPSGDNSFTKSLSYADERQRRKMADGGVYLL